MDNPLAQCCREFLHQQIPQRFAHTGRDTQQDVSRIAVVAVSLEAEFLIAIAQVKLCADVTQCTFVDPRGLLHYLMQLGQAHVSRCHIAPALFAGLVVMQRVPDAGVAMIKIDGRWKSGLVYVLGDVRIVLPLTRFPHRISVS
ncbi:hypothetical protein ALP86_103029 [Pseudomonas amygdali pv. mori]|nr:hypothetical protein ALP86_103029 [Pseudomonas amygdali pv. mori]